MRGWVVAAFAVVVLVVVGIAAPASAGTTVDRWTDGEGIGSSVGVGGNGGGGGSGGSGAPICTYGKVNGEDSAVADTHFQKAPYTGTDPGAWFLQTCTDANGNTNTLTVWFAEVPNDPVALAQQALSYARLPLPQILLSPSSDAVQLVGVPTWLSVNANDWKPVSATASAGGTVVTTTATPVRVVWSTGDGTTTTCTGPGSTFDKSKPNADQRSDCTHTYAVSSAGKPDNQFTITATQTWNVTWTATGAPAGTPVAGGLGPVTRVANLPVRVGEVQTLNQRR